MSDRFQRYLQSPLFGFLLTAALSMGIYAIYGFAGWLHRDDAIYLYAGQQFAEGVAPYQSVFDHKTPLTPIISGVCVFYGRLAGLDDVLAVRLGWWLMSGLTGGIIYLLGRALYRNAMIGLLSGIALTGFWTFGREAVSGPRAKSPFVLFEVLFFYCAARGLWGWAGVAAALATWVWQPGVVFVLAALILPLVLGEKETSDRVRNFSRALAGVVIPSVALLAYFVFQGAFQPLIEGSTLFNLTYLDRPAFSLIAHLLDPVRSLYKGYTMMALPAILGLGYLLLHGHSIFYNQIHRLRDWPLWAPVLVTLPFVILWTFLDFQGAADLYPFLPYMVLGIGGMMWKLCQGICSLQNIPGINPDRVAAVVLVVMIFSSAILYESTSENGLEAQRVSASQVFEKYGNAGAIASIGLPELLVLTRERNPNPYSFIIAGIDRKIDSEWPGGIVGFAEDFPANNIQAIGLGQTEGENSELLFETLRLYYKKERFGYFDVFVRTKAPRDPSDPLNN